MTDQASPPFEGTAPRRGKLVPPGEGTVIGEDVFKLLSSESPHYDVNEFTVPPSPRDRASMFTPPRTTPSTCSRGG